MVASLLLLAFAVLLALSVGVYALFLWLACRWWKIPDVRLRRVVLIVVGLAVFSVLVRIAAAWTLETFGRTSEQTPSTLLPFDAPRTAPMGATILWLLLLGELAAALIGTWALLKWGLRTSWKKAAAAGLTMLVPSALLMLTIAAVFRVAVAEAFVIPTGAMAPALVGVHADVVCANCSMPYSVSLSDRVTQSFTSREPTVGSCPNCGRDVEISTDAGILGGDRVLVEKISPSGRWNLVVFPVPYEPSVLYVKRLVAFPGEHLEIVAGDLFINGRRAKRSPEIAPEMWIPVSDTQYAPRDESPDASRWEPDQDSGWLDDRGQWTFRGGGQGRLSFVGRITDDLAYNGREGDRTFAPSDRAMPVADLRVACTLGAVAPAATLHFDWEFVGQRLSVSVSSAGQVSLTHSAGADDGAPGASARGRLDGRLANSVLTFMVRDGDAMLVHGGRTIAALAVLPDELERARDLMAGSGGTNATPSARDHPGCRFGLTAADGQIEVSRIVVSRDVYYTTLEEMGLQPGSYLLEELTAGSGFEGGDRLQLGPNECFALGDNSRRSKDCRFFGPVGFDTLVGTARCIYWPPKRWTSFE